MEPTTTPPLWRRLASMVYEAILLFGVVFIAGWLFDTLSQSRHALTLRHARQAWLFLVIGIYFVFFWCHGGQTLAMKTWRIKLVCPGTQKLPLTKAVARYLLAWMWFLPAMGLAYAFELKAWSSIGMITLGIALWAMTVWFDKDRQFLHDRLLGTRQISTAAAAAIQPGNDS